MSTADTQYEELKSLVRSMEFEHKKFRLRKIKASGQRVRNTLLDIKKLCDKMRKDIQAEIKAMPTRSKAVKIPKTKVEASLPVPEASQAEE